MITYKLKDETRKDSPVKVFLEGKRAGTIIPKTSKIGSEVKWYYVPKGQKISGEWFSSLEACKASLETE